MSESIEMEREFYIFGEPIETDLGSIRFLTYKEYLLNIRDLSLMSMNVLHIYYQYRKMFDGKDEEALSLIEQIKDENLYNIVLQTEDFRNAYLRIFSMVFEEEESLIKVFENEENFMFYRKLVLDMQVTTEDEVSPNPEIQKGIEISKKVKQQNAEKQTFTDIISSIVAGTGNSFKDVCDMTVYQIYAVFYRLAAIKSYDAETLFATVSEDVKISSWSRNIDLFTSEKSYEDKKTIDKKFGNLLK